MKKNLCIILTLLILLSATSFSACSNGGIAVGLVNAQNDNAHLVSFYSLKGSYSFELQNHLVGEPSSLVYSTSIENGEFNLYLQVNGEKYLITNTKEGLVADASEKRFEGVDFTNERSVKIIIEALPQAKNGKVFLTFKQKKA